MKYKYNGEWVDLSIKALDSMEIGTIVAYAGSTIPDGWLECNGASISQSTYPELYALIGGTLPNLKGRTIVGQDTSDTDFDTLGETGGNKALQKHKHNIPMGYGGSIGAEGINDRSARMANPSSVDTTAFYTTTAGTGAEESATNGNLQPYAVYKWIIKAINRTPTMASIVNTTNSSTTDAYSCDYVNNLVDYSTTEIKTGAKWIDGRPIYRKVLEKTSGFSTGESVINHGISNLAQLVSITGMAYRDGGDYEPIPATLPPSNYIGQYQVSIYDIDYQRFRMYIGSTGTTSPTKIVHLVIVFEYTKGTD